MSHEPPFAFEPHPGGGTTDPALARRAELSPDTQAKYEQQGRVIEAEVAKAPPRAWGPSPSELRARAATPLPGQADASLETPERLTADDFRIPLLGTHYCRGPLCWSQVRNVGAPKPGAAKLEYPGWCDRCFELHRQAEAAEQSEKERVRLQADYRWVPAEFDWVHAGAPELPQRIAFWLKRVIDTSCTRAKDCRCSQCLSARCVRADDCMCPLCYSTRHQLARARKALIERRASVFLTGDTGRGKTSAAVLLSRALCDQPELARTARFVPALALRGDVDKKALERMDIAFRKAETATLLILDDLGAELAGAPMGSDLAARRGVRVAELIQARFHEQRPIIMTSGFSDLRALYGAGVDRRVFERSTVIDLGSAT